VRAAPSAADRLVSGKRTIRLCRSTSLREESTRQSLATLSLARLHAPVRQPPSSFSPSSSSLTSSHLARAPTRERKIEPREERDGRSRVKSQRSSVRNYPHRCRHRGSTPIPIPLSTPRNRRKPRVENSLSCLSSAHVFSSRPLISRQSLAPASLAFLGNRKYRVCHFVLSPHPIGEPRDRLTSDVTITWSAGARSREVERKR